MDRNTRKHAKILERLKAGMLPVNVVRGASPMENRLPHLLGTIDRAKLKFINR